MSKYDKSYLLYLEYFYDLYKNCFFFSLNGFVNFEQVNQYLIVSVYFVHFLFHSLENAPLTELVIACFVSDDE